MQPHVLTPHPIAMQVVGVAEGHSGQAGQPGATAQGGTEISKHVKNHSFFVVVKTNKTSLDAIVFSLKLKF